MLSVYKILILFLFSINVSLAAENIEIRNGHINEGPPTVEVFAGYLDIINNRDKDIELVAANSPVFEKIEFHVTRIEQGVSSMHRQEKIAIPAKSRFSFSPGQYHLMLIHNNKPVLQGAIIPLNLVFADGETVRTDLQVIHISPGGHNHHQDR